MRDAAPGAAVAVRVGDAATQVPAAGGGDVGGGQFGGVQGDGPLVGTLVEVDAVAAVAAAAALAGAQQAAGAGGGHPQRAARRCGAGAAVPGAAGGEGVGVHGEDRARRHAPRRRWRADMSPGRPSASNSKHDSREYVFHALLAGSGDSRGVPGAGCGRVRSPRIRAGCGRRRAGRAGARWGHRRRGRGRARW